MVADGLLQKTNQVVKKRKVGYDDKYRHVEYSGERQVKLSIFFRTVKKKTRKKFCVSQVYITYEKEEKSFQPKKAFTNHLSHFHVIYIISDGIVANALFGTCYEKTLSL